MWRPSIPIHYSFSERYFAAGFDAHINVPAREQCRFNEVRDRARIVERALWRIGFRRRPSLVASKNLGNQPAGFVAYIYQAFYPGVRGQHLIGYIERNNNDWYATGKHDGRSVWIDVNVELCSWSDVPPNEVSASHDDQLFYPADDLWGLSKRTCEVG